MISLIETKDEIHSQLVSHLPGCFGSLFNRGGFPDIKEVYASTRRTTK